MEELTSTCSKLNHIEMICRFVAHGSFTHSSCGSEVHGVSFPGSNKSWSESNFRFGWDALGLILWVKLPRDQNSWIKHPGTGNSFRGWKQTFFLPWTICLKCFIFEVCVFFLFPIPLQEAFLQEAFTLQEAFYMTVFTFFYEKYWIQT